MRRRPLHPRGVADRGGAGCKAAEGSESNTFRWMAAQGGRKAASSLVHMPDIEQHLRQVLETFRFSDLVAYGGLEHGPAVNESPRKILGRDGTRHVQLAGLTAKAR